MNTEIKELRKALAKCKKAYRILLSEYKKRCFESYADLELETAATLKAIKIKKAKRGRHG